jgi:ATP-dependent helicase/nuclease subunit A
MLKPRLLDTNSDGFERSLRDLLRVNTENDAGIEQTVKDIIAGIRQNGDLRVMNLHKAKGLEAAVVVLAMPFGDWSPPPRSRVVRDETGRALGYATVTERKGQNQVVTLAQPFDWDAHAAEEMRFGRAEDERLLYVAATRPAQELIIGSASNPNSPSPWRSFYEWLRHNAMQIALPQPGGVSREQLTTSADELKATIDEVAARRAAHGRSTYRVAAVTDRKREVAEAFDEDGGVDAAGLAGEDVASGADDASGADSATGADAIARGTNWGSAVHDALLAGGRGLTGDALRAECRNVLIGYDRPIDADGTPSELDELIAIVVAVRGSDIWRRAQEAGQTLIEVPFAVRFTAEEYAQAIGVDAGGAAAIEVVDGRIDLIFREPDGWVLVDYKSDAAGERIPADLMRRYRGQLALYAAAWRQITGESVKERTLFFTATGITV